MMLWPAELDILAAAAACAGAAVVAVHPAGGGRRRISRWSRRPGLWASCRLRLVGRSGRAQRLAAGSLAAAVGLVLGVPWGVPLAVAAFVASCLLLSRLEPREVRRRSERVVADLPLAVELLAACLRSGRPTAGALADVAAALGGPLAERLTEVEHRLRLGADPVDAWGLLASEPACAPLARAVVRSVGSGGPLARTLEHLAADIRQQRRWMADERARAVETRSVVPLGLCFLPAFVLVGIVPTVAGSVSGLFGVVGG